MSTIAEIEEAMNRLSPSQQQILESRFLARQSLTMMDASTWQEFLASLDEAENEIARGEGLTLQEARNAVRSWIGT